MTVDGTLISFEAKNWKTLDDFYTPLLEALGAPAWHGRNVNALVDSMVYGDINELSPPYTIEIKSFDLATSEIREEVSALKEDVESAIQHLRSKGDAESITIILKNNEL